ncbi:class I SAM-dependent methyltransferase [Pseudomonas putida]
MTQFYRAFEDEHRGSHETIKQRLQVYLPFILPLQNLYPDCRAVDVGCGRGEWLETLIENGFNATGVDLDEGMLEACKTRQLPAEKAEALAYLRAIPSETLTVLTGFHIVEHIPFDDLKDLVIEANRVLKPGGLLILETPNAENLIVGTQNFYLDPTHERPIPHMLLEFLMKFSGFWRCKLLRLQENPTLAQSQSLALMDVLGGTSPDYAIIAQKDPGTLDISSFDAAFEGTYGLSMAELAQRYETNLAAKSDEQRQLLDTTSSMLNARVDAVAKSEEGLGSRLDMIERGNTALTARLDMFERGNAALDTRLDMFERGNTALATQVNELKTSVLALKLDELKLANDTLQRSLDESLKNAHHWYMEAEARQQHSLALSDSVAYKDHTIAALTDQVQKLKTSTSWRVTAPMRKSVIVTRMVIFSPFKTSKRLVKKGFKSILHRPGLRRIIKKILSRSPSTYARVQKLAARMRAEAALAPQTVQFTEPYSASTPNPSNAPAAPAHFTENAKAIYQRLNSNKQSKDMN